MAKFRCPRCGAVVEGLHDRCPRCNVLFRYRREDVELLTPYKAPEVQTPERIIVVPSASPVMVTPPAPAPVPAPVPEPEPEPVKMPEPEPEPAPVVEEELPAVEEAPTEEIYDDETKVCYYTDREIRSMKTKAVWSLILGLLSFLSMLFLAPFSFIGNLLGIIFGAIAISLAKKAKPIASGKAKTGKVFGTLGLIFSIVLLVLKVLFVILMLCLGGTALLGVGGFFAYYLIQAGGDFNLAINNLLDWINATFGTQLLALL